MIAGESKYKKTEKGDGARNDKINVETVGDLGSDSFRE